MTDHKLEVGIIVDLDIYRGSSAGDPKRDGSTWIDVGEETVSVPRCLPLGLVMSANVVDETDGRGKWRDVPRPRCSAI